MPKFEYKDGIVTIWIDSFSLFIDTFVAISLLTLLGVFPKEHIWLIMINSYSYKLFITVCNTPFFYFLVGMIKKFIIPNKLVSIEPQLNTA